MRLKKFFCITAIGFTCLITGCNSDGNKKDDPSDVVLSENSDENTPDTSLTDNSSDDTPDNSSNDAKDTSSNDTKDTSPSDAKDTSSNDTKDTSSNDTKDTSSNDTKDNVSTDNTSQADSADSGFYQICTSRSSSEVESFAETIRSLVVNRDWMGLSNLISYPITIDGITCEDGADFLSMDLENSLNPDFVSGIEAETCHEMFNNWQGICMADGNIWFAEVYSDESNSSLQIIGINGILQ